MENNEFDIFVTNPIQDPDKTVEFRGGNVKPSPMVKLSSKALSENANKFVGELNKVIGSMYKVTMKDFLLDEIKVSVAITATGKFSVVSFGVDVEGNGGVELVFKRKAN